MNGREEVGPASNPPPIRSGTAAWHAAAHKRMMHEGLSPNVAARS